MSAWPCRRVQPWCPYSALGVRTAVLPPALQACMLACIDMHILYIQLPRIYTAARYRHFNTACMYIVYVRMWLGVCPCWALGAPGPHHLFKDLRTIAPNVRPALPPETSLFVFPLAQLHQPTNPPINQAANQSIHQPTCPQRPPCSRWSSPHPAPWWPGFNSEYRIDTLTRYI